VAKQILTLTTVTLLRVITLGLFITFVYVGSVSWSE